MNIVPELARHLGQLIAPRVLEALDCQADFSLESLEWIDRCLVMRRRCKPFRDSGLTTDTHARIVCLGCYAGEVYLRLAKGHWLGLEKDHTRSANDFFDLGIAIEFTGVLSQYVKEPIRPVAIALQRFHGKASYTDSLAFWGRFVDTFGCESEKVNVSKIARERDHS